MPLALALLLYQSFALAASQIWANKVRGVLTTLGILIGVAAISAVIALVTGMRDMVVADFESFGANRLSIQPRWRIKDSRNGGRWKVVFKPNDFEEMLEKCPSLASFARDCGMGEAHAAAGGAHSEDILARLRGVDDTWHAIARRGVTMGRPLTGMDLLQVRRVCLIDEKLRDLLQLDRDPTGQMVETEFWGRFLVVGLLEPEKSMGGGDPQVGQLILPFTYTSYKLTNYPLWFDVTATAKSREVVEDARAEVEFYLRQKRHLRPGEEDNFRIETPAREIEQVNRIASLVTTIAGGVVAISLLVGGVGIMNIMLVSVSERTREIGLRKAVGAHPAAICLQFLVEAVVLCLVGAGLGLVTGQGLTSLVASFLPSDPSSALTWDPSEPEPARPVERGGTRIVLPVSAIELAFGFSVGIGLAFGIFPAMKAASLDPIEALRHE